MRGVSRDYEHEWFDDALAGLASISLQLDFYALMQTDPVFELDLLDRFRGLSCNNKIFTRNDGRLCALVTQTQIVMSAEAR